MSIVKQINNDLIISLKAGDSLSVEVLRSVNAVLKNFQIEKRGKGQSEELSEDDVLMILKKEVKKRKEAIELYRQGGRDDLADKEQKEILVLQKYLPEEMIREAVEAKVNDVLERSDSREFGVIMKEVIKELGGRADGKVVAEILKGKLD